MSCRLAPPICDALSWARGAGCHGRAGWRWMQLRRGRDDVALPIDVDVPRKNRLEGSAILPLALSASRSSRRERVGS